jgi:cell wall-associated NlpC family hydrolase
MCFIMMAEPAGATSTKNAINAKKQQKEQIEDNIDNLNDQISNLESQKEAINDELDELGNELLDLLTSISICKDEINDKEEQVRQAKADLEEAQNAEAKQYEDMKTRMKFMYEQGETAYLQVCLEAKSISDMVNKADYVERVYDYDRELLVKYQSTKDAVEQLKLNLEEEEAELLACQYELEEEQDQMERTIAEKKATVANFEAELSSAQAKVSDYKKELKKQTDEIKQLEEKQKQEAAAKAAASAQKSNSGSSSSSSSSSSSTASASTATSGTGSATGQAIANYACQFVGNPYVYGGTSLTNGTDCSGFTQAVYAHFGISIPRDSTSQRSVGRAVSYAEAAPGDIICYAGHVAIYLGNGSIVHASSERTGIKYGTATYRTILSIRRVV